MSGHNHYSQFIIFHKNGNSLSGKSDSLLRFAICSEPVSKIVLYGLSKNLWLGRKVASVFAVPEEWDVKSLGSISDITHYEEDVPINQQVSQKNLKNSWFVISNGRFATQISSQLLHKVLDMTPMDIIMINANSDLLAYREKIILASKDKVVGYRRCYFDSVEPMPVPSDWPHHIFIKADVFKLILVHDTIAQSFPRFVARCVSKSLNLCAFNVAGIAFDLEMENGLLSFSGTMLNSLPTRSIERICGINSSVSNATNKISDGVKLIGKVILGKNVNIASEAIVVGPVIISDNVKIGQGAVISSSIIGHNVSVPNKQLLQNRIVKGPQCNWKRLTKCKDGYSKQISFVNFSRPANNVNIFKVWPRFSYAGFFKRIADFLAALIVLVLFAPIIPFIAMAIKLNSPGRVFFKDKRQGLHGKEFYCLKFRTMTVGADEIQDKLRVANQTDGPQFKMEDDPRVSAVGRFLRDTYIDEIPQFFNVLLGQMSLVGPRPSPESENILCPSWRDARLSVRPGMTGLWQVYRTREPMKDFQEWIYYDTKYIRDLSLKMDLWICRQTAKKMFKNFIAQF